MITEHLVKSYRVLANDISHRKPNSERNKKLEELIADIQLFGSSTQIHIVKALATEISKGAGFDIDPIMNDLRNDLRNRLDLEPVIGNVHWVGESE